LIVTENMNELFNFLIYVCHFSIGLGVKGHR
jgi:hypothetical protein